MIKKSFANIVITNLVVFTQPLTNHRDRLSTRYSIYFSLLFLFIFFIFFIFMLIKHFLAPCSRRCNRTKSIGYCRRQHTLIISIHSTRRHQTICFPSDKNRFQLLSAFRRMSHSNAKAQEKEKYKTKEKNL